MIKIVRLEEICMFLGRPLQISAIHIATKIEQQIWRIASGMGVFAILPSSDFQNHKGRDGRHLHGNAFRHQFFTITAESTSRVPRAIGTPCA